MAAVNAICPISQPTKRQEAGSREQGHPTKRGYSLQQLVKFSTLQSIHKFSPALIDNDDVMVRPGQFKFSLSLSLSVDRSFSTYK